MGPEVEDFWGRKLRILRLKNPDFGGPKMKILGWKNRDCGAGKRGFLDPEKEGVLQQENEDFWVKKSGF